VGGLVPLRRLLYSKGGSLFRIPCVTREQAPEPRLIADFSGARSPRASGPEMRADRSGNNRGSAVVGGENLSPPEGGVTVITWPPPDQLLQSCIAC